MNKHSSLLVAVLLLASCASTGVIPLGQNTYYIGKKDGAPGLGVSLKNKAAVYTEAREFCSNLGLEIKVLNEIVTPAAPARLGSTELEFSCVPKGSIATPTQEKPDQIIERRTR